MIAHATHAATKELQHPKQTSAQRPVVVHAHGSSLALASDQPGSQPPTLAMYHAQQLHVINMGRIKVG